MATTPFKLRSGNTSSFKNLGSSPVKQDFPKDKQEKYAKKGKKLKPIEKGGKTTKPHEQKHSTKNNPVINLPTEIKSKLPKEKKKETVRPITGFEYDKNKLETNFKNLPINKAITRLGGDIVKMGKGAVDLHKKGGKKIYDYFTKK